MRWAWLLAVVILSVLASASTLAITMSCPPSADVGQTFSIGVSQAGATAVRLNYHSVWHELGGASGSWSLSESGAGDITYWGDAYVDGQWISGGTDTCTVTITQPVDHPGSMTLTVTPSSIEYGQSFSIQASFLDTDGTQLITVYRGATTIGSKTNCAGITCTYSITDTPTSTGYITYKATGRDINGNDVSTTKTVTVTGATVPTVSVLVSPTTLTTGQAASFQVTASDSGNDLSQIQVFYGDGSSATQSCSGGSCSKTWSHSYAASGTFTAYATATDSQSHTATSQSVPVYVTSPADSDGDGVPDASDQCPSTPVAWRPVVTSGQYLGCACAEITAMVPDPTRDANACTIDTCSITASGAFLAVHTPAQEYAQPEGMVDGCVGQVTHDYACVGGVVVDNAVTCSGDTPFCANNACVPCVTYLGGVAMRQCTLGSQPYESTCNGLSQWTPPTPSTLCPGGVSCVCTLTSGGLCVTNMCVLPRSLSPLSAAQVAGTHDVLLTGGFQPRDSPVAAVSIVRSDGFVVASGLSCSDGFGDMEPLKFPCPVSVTDHAVPPGTYTYTIAAAWPAHPDYTPALTQQPLTKTASVTVSCPAVCTAGQRQCRDAATPQLCQLVSGCLDWADQTACGAAQTCSDGVCVAASCPSSASPGCFAASSLPDASRLSQYSCPQVSQLCWNCSAGYAWNAVAQQCVAAACTPQCVNRQCGGDGCGGSCGSCANDKVCSPQGQCVSVLVTGPLSYAAMDGAAFTLHYTFSSPATLAVPSDSWPYGGYGVSQADRSVTYTPSAADLGTHPLTVQAIRPLDTAVLGSMTTSVTVTCNPGRTAPAGLCCVAGATSYKSVGTPCTYGGDPNGGTCNPDGQCVQACYQDVSLGCSANKVYHFDSCGNKGDLVDDCTAHTPKPQQCVQDGATAGCVNETQDCVGPYLYACRGNEGIRTDTVCGTVTTVTTCTSSQVCVNTTTGVSCRAKGVCDDRPGTVPCGNACLDVSSDWSNCGACGQRCTVQQQCVQGTCTALPGCHVACSVNSDCDAGYACVQGGDCYASRCEPLDLLTNDPVAFQSALQHGLVTVQYAIDGSVIRFKVLNLGPPVNVTLDATFGKVIAERASDLAVDGSPVLVLNPDPELEFLLGNVVTEQEFTVTASHPLDPSYTGYIALDLRTGPISLQAWNTSGSALQLGLLTEQTDNGTKFRLNLQPSKSLTGVTIPIDIPKCMAQYASELDLQGNYEIIQDDPLIAWHFDTLDQATEIQFTVPKDVDEDCKAQLTS